MEVDRNVYDEDEFQLIKDYQEVFNNDTGKKVLNDLLDKFDALSFKENPYTTAFREGRRAVIIYIKDRVGAKING